MRRYAAAFAIVLMAASRLPAQQTARPHALTPSDTVGVLLVAHGADAEWNARVDSLALQVQHTGALRGPVGVSFLMGPSAVTHRFQDVVTSLRARGARHIVVVPLFVSSHSGHFEQVRFLAGLTDSLDPQMRHHLQMAGIERQRYAASLAVTGALDDAPELAQVIGDRIRAAAPAGGRPVLILGHGPNESEEYARWMTNLRAVADVARAATGAPSVVVELVRDDAPPIVRTEAVRRARELVSLQRAASGADVVVVPLLISSGNLLRRTLPADLAGLPATYAPEPILPHPAIANWVARRVRESLASSAAAARGGRP